MSPRNPPPPSRVNTRATVACEVRAVEYEAFEQFGPDALLRVKIDLVAFVRNGDELTRLRAVLGNVGLQVLLGVDPEAAGQDVIPLPSSGDRKTQSAGKMDEIVRFGVRRIAPKP